MTKLSVVIITFALISASTCSEWCSRSKSVEKTVPTCSAPVEKLMSGRMVNGTISRVQKDLLPSWVNLTLAQMGQEWAVKNKQQIQNSHLFGLIIGLAFPDAYNVLLFTNQSDTPERAAKRYAKTISEENIWYDQDFDGKTVTKSLLRVRAFHTAAMIKGNKRVFKEKTPLFNRDLYKGVTVDEEMWSAYEKDLEMSNIPANKRILPKSYNPKEGSYYVASQFAMSLTQYAFVGIPVLFPERLFIMGASEEDLIAYNHLWAVLGYALGIDDKYNIALQPDLESVKAYYQTLFEDWFIPFLFNCDFYCQVLIEAMLKGLEQFVDAVTPRTMLFRLLTEVFKIPAPNMEEDLKLRDATNLLKFYKQGMETLFENRTVCEV